MNVANLQLCRELYELSGWVSDIHWIEQGPNEYLAPQRDYPTVAVHDSALDSYPYFSKKLSPAYDLGYLLRKLPASVKHGLEYDFHLQKVTPHLYRVFYRNFETHNSIFVLDADTPEDAAAKLAIELFKQGVLEQAA